jgi:hypothetical protein
MWGPSRLSATLASPFSNAGSQSPLSASVSVSSLTGEKVVSPPGRAPGGR